MRYIIYKRGGYGLGVVGTSGGETDGSVYGFQSPIAELEAGTKGYVENKLSSITTSAFTSGSLPGQRLPEFTGDIIKADGSTVTTFIDSGVVPGTYPKVQVTTKGIVRNSFTLAESDIPDFSWNKIDSDKPTTLGGYGITDALAVSGGTMTGTLSIGTVINDSLALVNKGYADSAGTSSIGISAGGIVYRTSPITPAGFLRCNGGILSKDNYPALYAAIGDRHSSVHVPGYGRPWYQQDVFNEYSTESLNNWQNGPSLAGARHGAQVAVIKNKVYLFGGANDSTSTATVQMATVDEDGNLSAWSVLPNLPFVFYRGQLAVIKNYIYFFGDVGAKYIYRATINPDGSYQTPVLYGNLPFGMSESQVVVTKNRVYLFSGNIEGSRSEVIFTATYDSNGDISATWNNATVLPAILTLSAVAVVKKKVYLFGGYRGSNGVTDIFGADLNDDGTITGWTNVGTLSAAIYGSSVIVTKNKIIMLTGSSAASLIRYFPINADGTLGTVQNLTGHFISSIMYCQVAIVKNRVYVVGGYDGTNLARASVYYHTFEGGSNDYTKYYDGSFLLVDSVTFRLPDITPKLSKTYAYIKY